MFIRMRYFLLRMVFQSRHIHVGEGLVSLVSYGSFGRCDDKCDLKPEDLVCAASISVIGPNSVYRNLEAFFEAFARHLSRYRVPYFSIDFFPLSDEEQRHLEEELFIRVVNGDYVKTVVRLWDYPVVH